MLAPPGEGASGAGIACEPGAAGRGCAALLLPESPAVTEAASKGGAAWGSEVSQGTGAEHVTTGQRYLEGDARGARDDGAPDREIRVFADTLGMQGGSSAATREVLRSTYPQPRHPLAPLPPVTVSDNHQTEEGGGAAARATGAQASPQKGTPQKAPKVLGADRAAADQGGQLARVSELVPGREGASHAPASPLNTPQRAAAERSPQPASSGVEAADPAGTLSAVGIGLGSPASSGASSENDAIAGGVAAIDHVNSSIVRARIGPGTA